MWIVYLVIAVVLTTGTGAYLASDTNTRLGDTARIEAPQVQAEEANRIARALRRMYQDNPGMFPARPTGAPRAIPNALVAMTLAHGTQLPAGVSFVLQSDGAIVTVFAPTADMRSDLVMGTFNRVVEREGGNTDQYGRVEVLDRGADANPLLPLPVYDQTGTETDNENLDDNETVTDPVEDPVPVDDPGTGNDSDGTVDGGTGGGGTGDTSGTGGGGTGGTESGGTGGTEGGATDGTGGGGTDGTGDNGTGGTGGGEGAVDEGIDLETGEGGSTTPNTDSFLVNANNDLIVLRGYGDMLGPRAQIFDVETDFKMAYSGGQRPSENLRPIFFEDQIEAGSRVEMEEEFLDICSTLSYGIETDIEDRVDRIGSAIASKYMVGGLIMTPQGASDLSEDLEGLRESIGLAMAYCLSVNTDRTNDSPSPVRANRGNFSNERFFRDANTAIQNWYMENNQFRDTSRITFTIGKLVKVLTAPERQAALNDLSNILAMLDRLEDILDTYGYMPGDYNQDNPAPDPEPEAPENPSN